MPELTAGGRVLRLAYSMNVHAGETVEDIEAAIKAGPVQVRKKLFGDKVVGAGLRLSAKAATTLAEDSKRLESLRDLLEKERLAAFTANAFPYGDFHGERVKESVYRPGWHDRERLAYSLAAAFALANLRGGAQLTISTVGGAYRGDADSARAKEEMARNLGLAASALHNLRDETGVSVRLCLEPEPLTTLETVADVIDFFRKFVYPHGERALHGTAKYNPTQATDILHEHLGLCFDCCHQAVLYEDPVESIDRLDRAGIAIGKVQLTCALEGPVAEMQRFSEKRYFHQVTALGGKRAPDLEGLGPEWGSVNEARSHFHVPVFLEKIGGLRTTRPFLEKAVREIVKRGLTTDLEIETYTWDVIPEKERKECGETLVDCIVKEYQYVLEMLKRI